jgi:hypothetical protein
MRGPRRRLPGQEWCGYWPKNQRIWSARPGSGLLNATLSPARPAARRRLPRDALGGEVLPVGGAPRVPIKIPPVGMVMCGAYG